MVDNTDGLFTMRSAIDDFVRSYVGNTFEYDKMKAIAICGFLMP